MPFSTLMQCVEECDCATVDFEGYRCIEETAEVVNLSDTAEEYRMLDDIIEESENYSYGHLQPLSPLLSTPFRMPPLKNGSRFGAKDEPSLFYGALDEETSIHESAFYTFQAYCHSDGNFEGISLRKCVFSVKIRSNMFIDLTTDVFSPYLDELTSTTSYASTRRIGAKMREHRVEGIIYFSARLENHKNFALYSKNALACHKASKMTSWIFGVTKDTIMASAVGSSRKTGPIHVISRRKDWKLIES